MNKEQRTANKIDTPNSRRIEIGRAARTVAAKTLKKIKDLRQIHKSKREFVLLAWRTLTEAGAAACADARAVCD